jgi:hypothetical protein
MSSWGPSVAFPRVFIYRVRRPGLLLLEAIGVNMETVIKTPVMIFPLFMARFIQ